MNRDFWRGRRVLVTGASGFKGSWLSLWLEHLGADVRGYALAPPTVPSLFALAEIGRSGHFDQGDVRDPEQLRTACEAAAPEIVFHLAAQSLVRPSYADPVDTFATNVMGTVNLLESLRKSDSVRAVLVVTSDKCYENDESSRAFVETDPLGGHDPYSSSKACADIVAASYYRSFFRGGKAGVATVRAGNVIGGGDWAHDRLIPDVILALAAGKAPLIRNPSARRPWQHVLEALAGYLRLAERMHGTPEAFSEAWNFGPQEHDVLDVAEIATRICTAWGAGASWSRETSAQPHEAKTLILDAGKARERLGWNPRLSAGTAIEWTVEWYKTQAATDDARRSTLAQICRYEELP